MTVLFIVIPAFAVIPAFTVIPSIFMFDLAIDTDFLYSLTIIATLLSFLLLLSFRAKRGISTTLLLFEILRKSVFVGGSQNDKWLLRFFDSPSL